MTPLTSLSRLILAALATLVLSHGAQAWVLSQPKPPRVGLAVTRIDTSVDEMPPKMREAYIVGIQEELVAHGYRSGPADGVLGPRTRAAIRAYQRDAGLRVNGVASKEVLDHMKFVLPKVYARKQVGHGRKLVRDIQSELLKRGYYEGTVDGVSGPLTKTAAMRFQRDAGLEATGKVDLLLLDDLRRADPEVHAGREPASTSASTSGSTSASTSASTFAPSDASQAGALPRVTPTR